jgi:hypothetical protein
VEPTVRSSRSGSGSEQRCFGRTMATSCAGQASRCMARGSERDGTSKGRQAQEGWGRACGGQPRHFDSPDAMEQGLEEEGLPRRRLTPDSQQRTTSRRQTGRSDAVRLSQTDVLRGEGGVARTLSHLAHGFGHEGVEGINAANPRTGSGMQQAHVVCDGRAVEVVRNHVDGKVRGSLR